MNGIHWYWQCESTRSRSPSRKSGVRRAANKEKNHSVHNVANLQRLGFGSRNRHQAANVSKRRNPQPLVT